MGITKIWSCGCPVTKRRFSVELLHFLLNKSFESRLETANIVKEKFDNRFRTTDMHITCSDFHWFRSGVSKNALFVMLRHMACRTVLCTIHSWQFQFGLSNHGMFRNFLIMIHLIRQYASWFGIVLCSAMHLTC